MNSSGSHFNTGDVMKKQIDPYQLVAVFVSAPERPMSTATLAEAFEVNHSSMWRQLKKMIAAGIIEKAGVVTRAEGGPPTAMFRSAVKSR